MNIRIMLFLEFHRIFHRPVFKRELWRPSSKWTVSTGCSRHGFKLPTLTNRKQTLFQGKSDVSSQQYICLSWLGSDSPWLLYRTGSRKLEKCQPRAHEPFSLVSCCHGYPDVLDGCEIPAKWSATGHVSAGEKVSIFIHWYKYWSQFFCSLFFCFYIPVMFWFLQTHRKRAIVRYLCEE